MENGTDPLTTDPSGATTDPTGTDSTTIEPTTNVEPTNVIITDPTTGEPADGITQDEWDTLQTVLDKIQENTLPFVPDPSAPPSGMTFEQAQNLIEVMQNVDQGLYYLVIFGAAFFIWQIIKVLYQYIAGVIFG